MIPVVLIDDHPLAINGIGAWLEAAGRFRVAGTAATAAQARKLFENLKSLPRVVILDIALAEDNGLEIIPVLREIAKNRKAAPPGIVVCSIYEDPFLIQNAFQAGAGAYVAKTADIHEILAAIDAVLAGKTYLNAKYELPVRQWGSSGLSAREREIVSLIKRNLSSKQIAAKLFISVRTVENHLSHIYIKTNTSSRSELAEL